MTIAPAAFGTFRDAKGKFWVAVKPVCELLELNYRVELYKLKARPQFHPHSFRRTVDGRFCYQYLCLPASEFEAWILSISGHTKGIQEETGRKININITRLNDVRSAIKRARRAQTLSKEVASALRLA